MPKTMPVDPAKFLKPGTLAFPQIPLHAYKTPLSEERARRGDKALVEVLRHMMVVREFETMLGSFKAKGSYQDISYAYKGPAHLSIGQEGAAVGAALELKPDDHIFGSHRSHGEFIAKCLSAIAQLKPAELTAIMESWQGGDMLRKVEANLPAKDTHQLAEHLSLIHI